MPTLSQKNSGYQEIQLAFKSISYRLRKKNTVYCVYQRNNKNILFVKNDDGLNVKLGGTYSNQLGS